jgi:hypothetical protein
MAALQMRNERTPSRNDVLSVLESLVRQYAILLFDKSAPPEIDSEDLYRRSGQFTYDLENIGIAEYKQMLGMEDIIRNSMSRVKEAEIVGEEQRKKLPEELLEKINHYASQGRAVLDLSGKRYIVMARHVPDSQYAQLLDFLRRNKVDVQYLNAIRRTSFSNTDHEEKKRKAKRPETTPQDIINNFISIKAALEKGRSKADAEKTLADFYSIYEQDIEPYDREVQSNCVRCLENLIVEMGKTDGISSVIEQPPFRLNYVMPKQKVPARWNSVSIYASDDEKMTPITLSCVEFDSNHAKQLVQSIAPHQRQEGNEKKGRRISFQNDAGNHDLLRIKDTLYILTSPKDYPAGKLAKADQVVKRCIEKNLLSMDYVPYEIAIPLGFLPHYSQVTGIRSHEELNVFQIFGALVEPIPKDILLNEARNNPGRLAHYSGINVAFISPLDPHSKPVNKKETMLSEVQIHTPLSYFDGSEAGRAPHALYKARKYSGNVTEIFPMTLSEAVVKRNAYYVEALKRQLRTFGRDISRRHEHSSYPAERFNNLLSEYNDHIKDSNASDDLKIRLRETLFDDLLGIPITYARSANMYTLSDRQENLEKMISAVDMWLPALPEYTGEESKKAILEEYAAAEKAAVIKSITEFAEALIKDYAAHHDQLGPVERFLLGAAMPMITSADNNEANPRLHDIISAHSNILFLDKNSSLKQLYLNGLEPSDLRTEYSRLAKRGLWPVKECAVEGRAVSPAVIDAIASYTEKNIAQR